MMQQESRSPMSSPQTQHMTSNISPQKTFPQESYGSFVQAIRDGDFDRVE